MKCSKCGKEIVNIQTASCISGYDENGKHENWICEKCSFEWEKEHSCYPIDYDKKGITNFICKKCGSTEYEIKDKPNGTGIAHGLYCAKCGFWHKWLGKEELRQYDKKDSKDTIIARLQAENAALKERLEKAVELPVKVGDTVWLVGYIHVSADAHLQCVEAKITDLMMMKDLVRYGAQEGDWCHEFTNDDIGEWVFTTHEAAEARLAELKGEKE